MENGQEPSLSKDITRAQRLWVVSNYLLARDDCTYVWMSGFSANGAQQYGTLLIYPEYSLPVGAPTGPQTAAGGAWQRAYSNALVVVNQSDRAVTIPLTRSYRDENGTTYSGSVTLPKTSGNILLPN